MIVLGVMELDLALRVAQPSDLKDQSFSAEKQKQKGGTIQIA